MMTADAEIGPAALIGRPGVDGNTPPNGGPGPNGPDGRPGGRPGPPDGGRPDGQ